MRPTPRVLAALTALPLLLLAACGAPDAGDYGDVGADTLGHIAANGGKVPQELPQ